MVTGAIIHASCCIVEGKPPFLCFSAIAKSNRIQDPCVGVVEFQSCILFSVTVAPTSGKSKFPFLTKFVICING